MNALRQTLNQVLAGTTAPKDFLKAVDDYLAQPEPNVDALTSLIAAAEHLGLPEEIAKAARARLPAADVVGIGEATSVAGSDDTTEIMSNDATKVDIGEPTAFTDPERTELTTGSRETQMRSADPDKTEITTGGQPTRLRADPPGADPDRTVVTGGGDSTVVTGAERTVRTADIQRVAGDERTEVNEGGGDPFAMAAAPPAKDEHGPGSVLKGRFRLEEVIGQGGMGAVYKAVDLLKVEARDRNPYIAVKLLVGDFKEHPEAFIALQRESAKAQRLAHPNIATVYDFDRDGETVYMTMELMVGAELAKYIKKLPAGGLPVAEANKIIEQLCSGLQYAHARGLVHSDFKPGNAFLLDDGTVKLLDFGIARASKTKADAEGESTVFDPGQLGALTPAYATIEMFEGQDPDPRDDIYALACVAYELYTGKHPFNKMSAVKAKEKNLKVAPVAKLNKRQNKALLKALALHRDDRTPSVEQFWEGLKPRKDYTLQIAGGAVAGALLIGFLAYQPVLNVIHEREHAAIIAEIDSRDEARFLAALDQMLALPEARLRNVAERARGPITEYHRGLAEAHMDRGADVYAFPAALAEVDKLAAYFGPRDGGLFEVRQEYTDEQRTYVNQLREEFEALLADGRVRPDPDARDVFDVMRSLRIAQPDNALLTDQRVANELQRQVDALVARQQWQEAGRLLAIGLDFMPRNPGFLDRNDRVGGEIRRLAEDARVRELRAALSAASPQTLAQFRAVREQLEELGTLRPEDNLVRGLDARVRAAVDGGITQFAEVNDWAEADALLIEFARVLPLDALITMRASLTRRQTAGGYDMRGDAERAADLRARADTIRGLLADASFDEAFERRLTTEFADFTARTTGDTALWDAVRTEIALAHVARATSLGEADRYAAANTVLDKGATFFAEFDGFTATRSMLAEAERAFNVEQQRLARLARIDSLKETFSAATIERNAPRARETLDALRRELPADDEFIRTTGPNTLADMYLQLANQSAANPQNALNLARAGLQAVPNHPQLTQAAQRFERLVAQQAVRDGAGTLTAQNFGAFRTQYQRARDGLVGAEASTFETQVVGAIADRLTALDRASQFQAANDLRTAALGLFPGNQRLTQLQLRQPSRFAGEIRDLIGENRLTAAREKLAEAQQAERGHPELAAFSGQLDELESRGRGYYTAALQARQRNDQQGMQTALRQGLAVWADSPDLTELQRQIGGTRAPQRADDGSRPCTSSLAGHGRRGAAVCFDMVGANQRGPELVVVPGPAGGQPFVIGKNEITVGDYNAFCRATGCTSLDGDSSLPATGITIQQADAYLAWLSRTTGKQYRLPTDAEWLHAAGGGGDAGNRGDFNCRVMQGGRAIKGGSLLSATSGPENAWGIRNAVGNAQEWVRSGGTLQARGGSNDDPLTSCDVGLVRPHAGAADSVTGFRVVRSID